MESIVSLHPAHAALTHYERVGLDLHQHGGVDKAAYFHHRCGGADVAEELAVRLAYGLPVVYVRHEHARPHDVLKPGPGPLQGALYILESLDCLNVRIAFAYHAAIFAGGRGAG